MAQTFPSTAMAWKDVPIIGGYVSKAGRVKRIAVQGCEPGAYVAALAMWHSAPMLIWSLFGPDCIDLVDERRGRGHRRRRIQAWRNANVIGPEFPTKGYGWAIFKLGDLAQKTGWYMALADAGTDFLVNWMSLAMIFDGCEGAGNPYAILTQEPEGQVLIATADWLPLAFRHADNWVFGAGGSTVTIPSGSSWASNMSVEIEPFPGLDPPAGFIAQITKGAGGLLWEGTGDPVGDSGSLSLSGFVDSGILLPGEVLSCYYKLEKLGTCRGSWTVAGVRTGSSGLSPFGCGTVDEKGMRPGQTIEDWWQEWIAS